MKPPEYIIANDLNRRQSTTAALGTPRRRRANSEGETANIGRRNANARRIATRNLDELSGMCRALLLDGSIECRQAQFLLDWVNTHYEATQQWPGNVLYECLSRALKDGRLDPAVESELLLLLANVAGGDASPHGQGVSGLIPYEVPCPSIIYADRCFVVTGQFTSGPRKRVAQIIVGRGGSVAERVTQKTDYLLVGTLPSDEWRHSTHGAKISKAVELKASGVSLIIINERDWAAQLDE